MPELSVLTNDSMPWQDTSRLLYAFGAPVKYRRAFFPPPGQTVSDKKLRKYSRELCMFVLTSVQTPWTIWMVEHGGTIRENADGELERTAAWKDSENPVTLKLSE